MSEARPSSQRPPSAFIGLNAKIRAATQKNKNIEERMEGEQGIPLKKYYVPYIPKPRDISPEERDKANQRIQRMLSRQSSRSQSIRPWDSVSEKPSQGGKKETHTYKNKDYVVRTGQKGGRFILVGGKEKKKVYI